MKNSFKFEAEGSAYFRIWIVNVLLTLLTLGFYSPWATVRKLKFFASHTYLHGQRFEFHGQAWPIFKGRFALTLILGSWFLVSIIPWVAVVVLAGILATPYLLVLRFRYYLSSYEYAGVRFGFAGSAKEGYRAYGIGFLVSILSFFTGSWLLWFWHRRFILNHVRYGKREFHLTGRWWEFAFCYVPATFTALLTSGLWVALVYWIGPENVNPYRVWPWLLIYALPLYLVFLFCMASVNSRTGRFFWNHLSVGQIRFKADFKTSELFGIYVLNSLYLLVTFGLAWPWAKVGLLRYHAEHIQVVSQRAKV